MEWFVILGVPLIITIIICKWSKSYDGCIELFLFFAFLSLIINLMIGQALTPTYKEALASTTKLYPIQANGETSKNKYYGLTVSKDKVILNDGKTQQEYSIEEIKYDNEKFEMDTYSYTWDDSKFPYCLFITKSKDDKYVLIVPKDSGIVLEQ